jgi:aquaporin TIP
VDQADLLKHGAAEFVGHLTLIFVGAGSIIATQGTNLSAIGLAHGLAIGVMASAVGHISGGHFNPALTFGLFVTRRMEARLAAAYWFFQLTGAVIAALLLKWLLPRPDRRGEPRCTVGRERHQRRRRARDRAFGHDLGLAIGLTITLDIYMGGPYTGAAMNPARAFGPELADNFWSDGWIYWVGPLLGAAIAAFAYDRMYLRGLAPEPPGPPETGLEEPRPGDAASI